MDPGSGTNSRQSQAQTPRGVTVGTLKRGRVEDDKRETKPVGARGGPSTPPLGRDDEVPLVGAVLVEPGL
eukprot:scaffold9892_cov126-Isochrysis_galbana.AAC.2